MRRLCAPDEKAKGQFVSDGSVGAQVYASGAGKRAVPGAEARFVAGLDVRAEARTYLRSKNNGRSEDLPGEEWCGPLMRKERA